jgi:nucleoside-diphosphate-sugar epimerase
MVRNGSVKTLEDRPPPPTIRDVDELEDLLSTPTRGVVTDLAEVEGDILVLGAGGKVGPTLAMMAKRAAPDRRVVGVARFTDATVRDRLEAAGVRTLVCDLLDQREVEELPDASNVIYMAGRKFGTDGSEPMTWAMNVIVPAYVGQRFARSRIVALSTLCVYPFAPVEGPGSDERAATAPLGEYANSCVGRERVFEYFSRRHGTPGRLIRLNYAIDLRYGVLHDLGKRILNRRPIDLSTPVANVIWQGDSTAQILRSLRCCTLPSSPLNIGMPQPARIRDVAGKLGELLGIDPFFTGREQPTAWHCDTSQALRLFGEPLVDLDTMIRWNADWLQRRMPVYDKPTHYEERRGVF